MSHRSLETDYLHLIMPKLRLKFDKEFVVLGGILTFLTFKYYYTYKIYNNILPLRKKAENNSDRSSNSEDWK